MAGLPDLQVTTSSTQLADDAAAWGQSQIPNWALEAGDLETILTEMFARMASILAVLAQTHARDIYQDFVATVFRIPVLAATSATGTVAFTLTDTLGHTIPVGTQVTIGGVAFTTTDDLIAPSGTGTINGTVVAAIPGSAGSGLSGPVTVEDLLDFVQADAAMVGITTGGTDGETVDDYVDRVHDELPTLSLAVITPRDAELVAMSVPGVDLALAIDRYVPAGPDGTPAAQTNVDGAIHVISRDSSGAGVGSAVNAAVLTAINQRRVTGLSVTTGDPTITAVDVTFTAEAYPGWDATAVQASAVAAVEGFLSGATWGLPRSGQAKQWIDEPTVRRNDLFGVLYDVQGVRHVDTLTLALGGGVQGTADLTLPGPGALPSPGAITGTVTPT